jgi:hypothetical protein
MEIHTQNLVNKTCLNKVQSSKQTVKLSGPAQNNTPRSITSLTSTYGLPSDKLSASIISFARFFSLSLKPDVLALVRRQAFLPQKQNAQSALNTPITAKAAETSGANLPAGVTAGEKSFMAKARETFSLAAAAAESKGVELTVKGLETYAEAVDPDLEKRHDKEHQRRGRDRKQEEQKEEAPQKAGGITASELKESAIEYTNRNPLLDILNRLPSKTGHRWIVLPFNFSQGDSEYRVSMRVLLDKDNLAVTMALDISELSELQRWLFILENKNNAPGKVTVYLKPEISLKEQKKFKTELSKYLDIPDEKILIKTYEESFPLEGAEPLHLVDEAV